MKPVKSFFSAFAHTVRNPKQLTDILKNGTLPPKEYLKPFDVLLKQYTDAAVDSHNLIAETLLEGVQCTLEGYIQEGSIMIMGIVDSVMFPGTISFERFEYPSKLPMKIQEKMSDIAMRCIHGLNLDNTPFNIEYMYNPKTEALHVIEVNPRMASQNADLFEKVDGTNGYTVAFDLATGAKPLFYPGKGKYKVAASFVLRSFEDQRLLKNPTVEMLEQLKLNFPDIRLETNLHEGQKLSEIVHDVGSYRYGLIHLGANSWEQLYDDYAYCKEKLPFVFQE